MGLAIVTINDKQIAVEPGTTILEAANKLNIHIPTLCHLDMHDIKMVNKVASCRVCVVEVAGRRNLAPACATPVTDGTHPHSIPSAIKPAGPSSSCCSPTTPSTV